MPAATTTTNSPAASNNLPHKAVYLGCYVDKSTRDLPIYINEGSINTVEQCINDCYNRYATYAGVQYRYAISYFKLYIIWI